jgi:acyl dehydratase
MCEDMPYKRTLNEFRSGQIFQHWPHKTVTESDNNLFCLLTMNHHPIHSDFVYAENSQHKKVLVVGTYVLSLVVGMSVPDISGVAIANLEYEKVIHDNPVFIGDTIRAESEIIDVKYSKSKKDRGIVYVKTCAYNQNDVRVLTFRRKVLIPVRLSEISIDYK